MHKFYIALILIFITFIALSYDTFIIVTRFRELSLIFFIQSLFSLGCYLLLGVGFGLVLVLLATTLGWVQLLLLITGNIDPHLAKEGLLKVLHTLFKKI